MYKSHDPEKAGAPGPGRPAAAPLLGYLSRSDPTTPLPVALLAAALCLAVGLVHVQDQGGFLGTVSPTYMKIGYYVVEIVAAVTLPFLIRQTNAGWLLGAAVGLGPFLGYLASRTVGLPGDPDDVGNWGYTLGTVSLILEGSLFLLAGIMMTRSLFTYRTRASLRRPRFEVARP